MGPSLTNIRALALAVIYFGIVTASVGLVLFVPQIIKQLGVSNLETGFLTMIPYVVGTASMIVWGYASGRSPQCASRRFRRATRPRSAQRRRRGN